MEFFNLYPKIVYNNRNVKNITIRIDFIKQIKDNIALYDFLQLRDGERPEDVAFSVYGDANLYWIILFINDITDPYLEWLLTPTQLMDHIQQKYGVDNVYATNHYETTEGSDLDIGTWVNEGTPFSQAISNYDYEDSLNEAKRKIKLIKQDYITQVLNELKKELS